MSNETIRVKFSLGIGLIHKQEDIVELNKEEYTNPDGSINEAALDSYLGEWANNYIDMHFKVLDDTND